MAGVSIQAQMKRWKALKIKVKRRYIDPLCGFLYLRGSVGLSYDEIVIEETSLLPDQPGSDFTDLTAYFPTTADTRTIARELADFVARLPKEAHGYAVDSVEVEDFGWADRWKEFFRPLKVGRAVTVTPSWETYEAPAGETVMVIDPGQAFGTGSHETTRLCIELIEKEFDRSVPERCLDIGCGTGILGILMAKKGARNVLGVDIDDKAVRTANRNARRNGTGGSFRATNRPLGAIGGKFDFLSANIIAETLVSMKSDFFNLLGRGGRAVLSGILVEKKDWVVEEFQGGGFHVTDSSFLGIWSAVAMKKE